MTVIVQFINVGRSRASWQAELSKWDEVLIAREAKTKLASRFCDAFIRDEEPDIADIVVGGYRVVGVATRLLTDKHNALRKAKDYKEVFK